LALERGVLRLSLMPIATVNPFTNETLATFPEDGPGAIEQALATAKTAFTAWRSAPLAQRATVLHSVASLLRQKKTRLAKVITTEMGKLVAEAEGELALSADIFDYYAAQAPRLLADTPVATKHGEAFIRHSPVGVLLGVEPWNFPFYQVARFAAPNLMIGNVVLIKHASNVPQCAQAIADVFREAQAPAGVYTNLLLQGAHVAALLDDPRVAGASLTGSEEAGASLAMAAGKNLKKSVLELGGSDAFIVLEDADLEKTVEWAFVGRMNNTGQCCVAAKRFIVVDAIADAFTKKFVARLSNLKVGDPLDETTTLGPLSSEGAAVHLEQQVARAVAAGAKVLLGGKRIARKGAFFEATVLTGVAPGSPSAYEEFFGPVAVIFRVKDERAAITLANDSPFGLGGSVFTSDVARGKRVASELDTGMVFINHPTWTAPELPFGGVKRSGYGRELSALGVEEFVNKKLIRVSALTDPF
jgi:succinate-semialdehyde dehydrogenase / glutarate-semialdehyde dehydrogenase